MPCNAGVGLQSMQQAHPLSLISGFSQICRQLEIYLNGTRACDLAKLVHVDSSGANRRYSAAHFSCFVEPELHDELAHGGGSCRFPPSLVMRYWKEAAVDSEMPPCAVGYSFNIM